MIFTDKDPTTIRVVLLLRDIEFTTQAIDAAQLKAMDLEKKLIELHKLLAAHVGIDYSNSTDCLVRDRAIMELGQRVVDNAKAEG